MKKKTAFVLVAVGFAASGATCKERDQSTRVSTSASATSPPDADFSGRSSTRVETAPSPPVTEMDGIDLVTIAPELRSGALRLLNENYCYCGCARTVASCLADRAACPCVRCSERMANFILDELREDATLDEVEMMLIDGFSDGYNAAPRSIDPAGQPTEGPADAAITVAEFADFKCPHCAAAHEVLGELRKKRSDVRIAFFYFPLAGGGELSLRAAEAAEEAHQQGKFWPMADLLFRSQHALEDDDLMKYGASAGLDVARLEKALTSHQHRGKVLANKRMGEALGIQSTPALFVAGRNFGLSRTLRNFELRIDMEKERGRCD